MNSTFQNVILEYESDKINRNGFLLSFIISIFFAFVSAYSYISDNNYSILSFILICSFSYLHIFLYRFIDRRIKEFENEYLLSILRKKTQLRSLYNGN